MDITKKVAALRFKYHANMLDVCNVLNQIGILKDEKAESVMKNHTMQCFDCLERLGYPIEKFLKEQEKEPRSGLFLLYLEADMRYHYEKPPIYLSMYGQRYCCDHPVYNHCTLFLVGERGLAVIQQRYDPETKHTFWAEVDEWLTDPLYLHPRFRAFFDRRAGTGTDGLYPTVTIRQIMWALKMKPLPKQPWETVFDHTPI